MRYWMRLKKKKQREFGFQDAQILGFLYRLIRGRVADCTRDIHQLFSVFLLPVKAFQSRQFSPTHPPLDFHLQLASQNINLV